MRNCLWLAMSVFLIPSGRSSHLKLTREMQEVFTKVSWQLMRAFRNTICIRFFIISFPNVLSVRASVARCSCMDGSALMSMFLESIPCLPVQYFAELHFCSDVRLTNIKSLVSQLESRMKVGVSPPRKSAGILLWYYAVMHNYEQSRVSDPRENSPKWPKTSLSYKIFGHPHSLTGPETMKLFRKAFKTWSKISALRFTPSDDTIADINIRSRIYSLGKLHCPNPNPVFSIQTPAGFKKPDLDYDHFEDGFVQDTNVSYVNVTSIVTPDSRRVVTATAKWMRSTVLAVIWRTLCRLLPARSISIWPRIGRDASPVPSTWLRRRPQMDLK